MPTVAPWKVNSDEIMANGMWLNRQAKTIKLLLKKHSPEIMCAGNIVVVRKNGWELHYFTATDQFCVDGLVGSGYEAASIVLDKLEPKSMFRLLECRNKYIAMVFSGDDEEL